MHVEKWGRWLFLRRGELQIPLVLVALALLRPQYPFGSHWLDELADIIGYLLMLGGVGIRFWVIGYRKSGTSGRRGREIKSAELVTDGLYAYVRNPLYLGNLVIILGVMIMFLNPWLTLVFFTILLHYYLIIRAEEDYLTQQFGSIYLAYKGSTPRLIPATWRRKTNPPSRKFDWNQVVKKEKDLVLGVILTPIAIEIYEDILHEGWRQFVTNDSGELVVYLTLAISAFLIWLVVMYQKKRRIISKHERCHRMIKRLALDERVLKKISRYRDGFFLPLIAFMFLCRWNEYENDPVIWTVGPFLLLASLSIRIWATAHIGKRIPKRLRKGREKELVTTGPYSIVRNPLYIANIIATLGICVLFELLWFLPVTFLYVFAVYSVTVRYEEERLSRTFGVIYETYKKQVPRWFPKIGGFRRQTRRFPWFHVMLGESRSCLLGIFVLSLAMLKKSFF